MLYSRLSISLVVSAAAVVGLATQAMAQVKPGVVGVVDRDKVMAGYSKYQLAGEDIHRSEERVHKLIEESNKEFEAAKAQKKPDAELQTLMRRLQTSIDEEVKKVQSKAVTLENQLQADLDAAVKAEADARKVDTVFIKQIVMFGGVDLTDGVSKRLGAARADGTQAPKKPAAK